MAEQDASPTNPADVEDLNGGPHVDEVEVQPEPAAEEPAAETPAPEAPAPETPAPEPAASVKEAAPPAESTEKGGESVPMERFREVYRKWQDAEGRAGQTMGEGGQQGQKRMTEQELYEAYNNEWNANPSQANFNLIRQMGAQAIQTMRGEVEQRKFDADVKSVSDIIYGGDEVYRDDKFKERLGLIKTLNQTKLDGMSMIDQAEFVVGEYRKRYGASASAGTSAPASAPKVPGAVPKGVALGMGGAAGGDGAKNVIFKEDVEETFARILADEGEDAAEAYSAMVDKAHNDGRYLSRTTGKPA